MVLANPRYKGTSTIWENWPPYNVKTWYCMVKCHWVHVSVYTYNMFVLLNTCDLERMSNLYFKQMWVRCGCHSLPHVVEGLLLEGGALYFVPNKPAHAP
jgi:hypothetical protein